LSSLSNEEKQSLAKIIEVIYGQEHQLMTLKNQYNTKTVEAVEKALSAISSCNDNMKYLVTSLVGGGRLMSSGWLKRALRSFERELESNKIKFDGAGCRVSAARNWKIEIIHSTYGI
jgi:hypothetical protein